MTVSEGIEGRRLEGTVRPPSPVRLPSRTAPDGVLRSEGGIVSRLLHIGDSAIVVRAWQTAEGAVRLQAQGDADGDALELAVDRMRFALSLDDDLGEFYARFKNDALLGAVIRRKPWIRPRRRPWPWEALAWAIVAQLIESQRAEAIQRRVVDRWGRRGPAGLRDVPRPELVAERAPAELAALDLAPKRALALIRCAKETATGRSDLGGPDGDRRLLAIPEIGPWTVQLLALNGRGDHDSLPAGDLAYLKLVGRLANLGRRATIAEVDEFFAPYAPYRGLAGQFALVGLHRAIAQGPPLRLAA
jgi:3-methyladenine DNA glycosylase/8-oxoguanine DNA glycosylase